VTFFFGQQKDANRAEHARELKRFGARFLASVIYLFEN
jgi:hypothetical protein